MTEGTDLTIICCGIAVLQAVNAARTLAQTDGVSVRVINMHTIKPLDREAILKAVTETRRILTVEEHNVVGGLGDAVGQRHCRIRQGLRISEARNSPTPLPPSAMPKICTPTTVWTQRDCRQGAADAGHGVRGGRKLGRRIRRVSPVQT